MLSICMIFLLLITWNTHAIKNDLAKENEKLILLNDSLASENKLSRQQVLYFLKYIDTSKENIVLPGNDYFKKDSEDYESRLYSDKSKQR